MFGLAFQRPFRTRRRIAGALTGRGLWRFAVVDRSWQAAADSFTGLGLGLGLGVSSVHVHVHTATDSFTAVRSTLDTLLILLSPLETLPVTTH